MNGYLIIQMMECLCGCKSTTTNKTKKRPEVNHQKPFLLDYPCQLFWVTQPNAKAGFYWKQNFNYLFIDLILHLISSFPLLSFLSFYLFSSLSFLPFSFSLFSLCLFFSSFFLLLFHYELFTRKIWILKKK
jgi:hypothetical protein